MKTWDLAFLFSASALVLAGACNKDDGNEGGSSGTGGGETETGGSEAGGSSMNASGGSSLGGGTGVDVPAPEPFSVAESQNDPTGIDVDDEFVYWMNRGDGQLVRCPLAGCDGEPEVLVEGLEGAMGLAVTPDAFYWLQRADDPVLTTIHTCERSDCQPRRLGDIGRSGQFGDVEPAMGTVYYGAHPFLGSCSEEGCRQDGPTEFMAGPTHSLDIVGDQLYHGRWGWHRIDVCTIPDCDDFSLVTEVFWPRGLAVDETEMIFGGEEVNRGGAGGTTSHPGIFSCALESCEPSDHERLVELEETPYAIAMTETHFYYTDQATGDVVAHPRN